MFLLLMKVAHELKLSDVLTELTVPQLQFSNIQFFITTK
jgi:hypothetical protein